MKTCRVCRLEQPLAEYYFGKGRRIDECRTCVKTRVDAYRKLNGRAPRTDRTRQAARGLYRRNKLAAADGRTEQSFKQKFDRHGITLDQYHSLAERQDFLCAICHQEPPPQNARQGNVDNFVIDHDHETGRVRALLCWLCNAALGSMQDCPIIGRSAVAYLEHHHAKRPCAAHDSIL